MGAFDSQFDSNPSNPQKSEIVEEQKGHSKFAWSIGTTVVVIVILVILFWLFSTGNLMWMGFNPK